MSIKTQKKKERDCRIDILKGVAIIAVVFYHLCGDYVPFGYLGVDIFLAIVLISFLSSTFLSWSEHM